MDGAAWVLHIHAEVKHPLPDLDPFPAELGRDLVDPVVQGDAAIEAHGAGLWLARNGAGGIPGAHLEFCGRNPVMPQEILQGPGGDATL
jgi:hypothetical protein